MRSSDGTGRISQRDLYPCIKVKSSGTARSDLGARSCGTAHCTCVLGTSRLGAQTNATDWISQKGCPQNVATPP